jgi:hypothetical protein
MTQLRRHFEQLRPVPAARHATPAVFVHKDLADYTHVSLQQDAVRRPLDPPYSGPYKVLGRTKKTLRISMNGRPVTVSTDREPDDRTVTTRTPPEQTTHPAPQPSPPATLTTRSGRHIRFSALFNV